MLKKLALTFVTLAGLTIPVAAQGNHFALRVCNNTSDNARVAVHGKNGGWIVKGWWYVPPGQCRNIETLEQGYVDVYAEVPGTTRQWGSGVNMCVPRSDQPFVRDSYSGYQCGPYEVLRRAARIHAITNTGVFTWHLDPRP